MNIITETKLISLTSESATQYNNSTYLSNIVFDAPGLFVADPKIINVELSLLHAEIPVSFYNINESNSWFKFALNGGSPITAQVPLGNYNASSLIDALTLIINNTNFTITISRITGKLTFHYNLPFIIYTDNTNSIGGILGFNLNTVYTPTSLPNYTINAPYLLNLLGIKKLNILSSEIISSNYSSVGGTISLLASIPVDQPSYGLIVYENKSNFKYKINNAELSKIDIQIQDESHNFINFNNTNWAMLFSLIITYDLNINLLPNIVDNIPNISPITENIPNKKPNKKLQELKFLSNNNIID